MEEITKVDSRILMLTDRFQKALVMAGERDVLVTFKRELQYLREQRSRILARNTPPRITTP